MIRIDLPYTNESFDQAKRAWLGPAWFAAVRQFLGWFPDGPYSLGGKGILYVTKKAIYVVAHEGMHDDVVAGWQGEPVEPRPGLPIEIPAHSSVTLDIMVNLTGGTATVVEQGPPEPLA